MSPARRESSPASPSEAAPALALPDLALLAAYLVLAIASTLTGALLLNDAAVLMMAGWLGDAWDLYLGQFRARALAMLAIYGPAWGLRALLGLDLPSYMTVAQALYFALPLALWLAIRAVEPQLLYARLYLALALIQAIFPTELVTAAGLWTLWLAWIATPGRSDRSVAAATAILGAALAFTHPAVLLMSGTWLGASLVLHLARRRTGRPIEPSSAGQGPESRLLWAAAAMTALQAVAYLALSRLLPPSNPTVVMALANNRYDYIDPLRALSTFALFPMVPALWLLLLLPGLTLATAGRAPRPAVVTAIGLFGLWFAAAGTGLLTALQARHTAPYVFALAMALAQAAPGPWLAAARAPLAWCAAIGLTAALSYNADMIVFGRVVDSALKPGFTDVATLEPPWPAPVSDRSGARAWAKWLAGNDYGRDVVVPEYDWYRGMLAYYSFHRSNGTGALYHALGRRGDWIPFRCEAVARIEKRPESAALVDFLARGYCAR